MSGALRLRHRVGQAIASHTLWEPGQRIAVAVSGGMDSVVLLDVLVEIAAWHRGELMVVTVDHGTPHAARHAAWVEAHAASLGLPCRVFAVSPKSTSEEHLREARYAAFEGVAADRIALGHHADDLAETVLLHLLRGTGVRGLAGMARRRGRYVRPLLDESRDSLVAWAAKRGLGWVEDPSNASHGPLRNRLRHEVLPLLEAARPGAAAAIARSARHAADVDAWLGEEAARHTPPWPTGWVAEGPTPVVRRALLAAVPRASAASLDAVIAAARQGRGRVRAAGSVFVVCGGSVTVRDVEGR